MWRVFGTNALAYQIANLTLFVSTGALLGLLALRLTKSAVTASLAGALFARCCRWRRCCCSSSGCKTNEDAGGR
jgi:hypothetical protein